MKAAPKYIDAHLHLQDSRFSCDRRQIINQAVQNGIEYMLCCGSKQADWDSVLAISGEFRQVIAFVGIHPWFVESATNGWQQRLCEIAATGCGIGEIGIDKLLTNADFKLQTNIFERQLSIAMEFNAPVSIHCLSAYGYLADILKTFAPLPQGSFIHSYSGSPQMLQQFERLGLMFSYNAKAINPDNKRYQQSFKATPLDRLLIETDSPFMPPACIGEERNTPLNLPFIAAKLAEIKAIEIDKFLSIVYGNAFKIVEAINRNLN